jgi:type I restriction enzyme S subunit
MNKAWPTVFLEHVIRLRKEFVIIDDHTVYSRARVQLHAKGVVQRDQVPGALIKTKKQQVCRVGELLVAEIDAKVGGFGLVPESLDGAIVSSHYFLFVIDETQLDKQFLDYYIRTSTFRRQVEAQGSTNYAAIRPADVLGYQIPLPPLPEQQHIVRRIDVLKAHICKAQDLRRETREEVEALTVSIHTQLACQRTKKLGELLKLDEEDVLTSPEGSYPQVGLRSFGAGLFPKAPVAGTATTYRSFNHLYTGGLVLSQVKGWEGAVAVCPSELEGWFVSPEYRTFRCISGEARPEYMATLVRTEWFWSKSKHATRVSVPAANVQGRRSLRYRTADAAG